MEPDEPGAGGRRPQALSAERDGLSAMRAEKLRRPRRAAVFHYNGIGDRALALPTVRALAERFRDRLILVGGPGDGDLFYRGLPVAQVYEADFPRTSLDRTFTPEPITRLLADTEVLISLNQWHNELVDAVMDALPAMATIGFAPRCDLQLPRDRRQHACDNYFTAAQALDPSLRLEAFADAPASDDESREAADALLDPIPAECAVMVLHSETVEEKMWPAERYRKTLETFLERHPHFVVLVVDQRNFGFENVSQGHRVIHLKGLPLGTAMAITRRADLFFGVDSCMLHVADLARVPSVGLFGPTRPDRWGLRFTQHRHVGEDGPMVDVPVGAVLDAMDAMAAAAKRRRAEAQSAAGEKV